MIKLVRRILSILIPFFAAIAVFATVVFFVNQSSAKGALQITSVPKSDVYLNGKLIGQTPLCKCEGKDMLSAGDYTIKLSPTQGGFESFEEKVSIAPAVLTVLDRTFGKGAFSQGSLITLSKLPDKKALQLSVISFPDKTSVYLDNNLSGETPLLLKNLTESDHELKLSREGYKDKIIKVRTVAGYKLEATITLAVNSDLTNATPSSSVSPTPTSSPTPALATVTILDTPTGFLRVRESNSVGSAQIGLVNPGEKYNLLDEKNGWYQIKLKDGKIGWVSNQYASKQ